MAGIFVAQNVSLDMHERTPASTLLPELLDSAEEGEMPVRTGSVCIKSEPLSEIEIAEAIAARTDSTPIKSEPVSENGEDSEEIDNAEWEDVMVPEIPSVSMTRDNDYQQSTVPVIKNETDIFDQSGQSLHPICCTNRTHCSGAM
ncbi:hypothetical protein TSTA_048120 [Talaromyces stipitatus ATCC 10500]|uniref:Uncharacterized protein n=1 Tax=Talaromyces stipitatus (strain ATCC 10500 / CBS 375.48 / QM 6759 / NRRL 1006) TaxID=441959 RepID=B8MKL3_TALSN|nr:uncharacterized protein TSTA_048120 [Talaromyces stipitatus ATCC 10500]EED15368.1 hypothetical protein TSTA_048120 [Talaromyces stipitatus ATCC 10500]